VKNTNLLAPDQDKFVKVRIQSSILPVRDGKLVAFDACYKSASPSKMGADLVITATRDGTSVQLVQSAHPQKLFFNRSGGKSSFILKHDENAQNNVLLVIRVPLVWNKSPSKDALASSALFFPSDYQSERSYSWSEAKSTRDDFLIGLGNVNEEDKPFPHLIGDFTRNKNASVTVTFHLFHTTPSSHVNNATIRSIATQINEAVDAPENISALLVAKKETRRADGKLMSKDLHPDVACNNCLQPLIQGARYKCASCPAYDLCEHCERLGHIHTHHLFFKIPDSRKHMDDRRTWDNTDKHRQNCWLCFEQIRGARFHCQTCDQHFCAHCEANSSHSLDHPLVMYRR